MSWRRPAYRAARWALFALEAEAVHDATLGALAAAGRSPAGRALCAAASGLSQADAARFPVDLVGLRFRNRVGLAAGFDKGGVALRGWAALGLGFVEVGTVTPRPQPGNPRPRLFRLAADEALVNHMGFNNRGAKAIVRRIALVRRRLPPGFVVGVNIGRNRDTPARLAVDDYVTAALAATPVADYLALNVSSPNTPGLRELQDPAPLGALLAALGGVAPRPPLLVKLSPDLEPAAFDAVVDILADGPAHGLVLSNTTLARNGLLAGHAPPGGLSGRPLLPRTLRAVERVRARTGSRFLLVASGGIASGSDAVAALDAGADLVQLWTGLVYHGPGLIGEAVRATRPGIAGHRPVTQHGT